MKPIGFKLFLVGMSKLNPSLPVFVKKNKNRGNCPIGVHYNKGIKKYIAQLEKDGKCIKIGNFDSKNTAFQAYKMAKEKYIKEVADEYKDKIPKRLYDAMYKYEVEITDWDSPVDQGKEVWEKLFERREIVIWKFTDYIT